MGRGSVASMPDDDAARAGEMAARPEGVAQRLRTAAIVVVLVLALPVGVATLLDDAQGAVSAVVGAVYGLLIAVRGGWRTEVSLVPFLVVASVAAAFTHDTWAWVALLGLLGVLAGYASHAGRLAPVALVGAATCLSPPAHGAGSLLVHAVLVAASAVYVGLLGRRLGLPEQVRGPALSRHVAMLGAAHLAVVAVVAAWLAQRSGLAHAEWLPMTVFLLVASSAGVRVSDAARHRLAGTLLGVVVGVALSTLATPVTARLVACVTLLLLVVAVTQPLWVNASLTNVLLMMVLSPTGAGAAELGETRLVATVAAAVLVAAGIAAVTWLSRRADEGAPGTTPFVEAQTEGMT